jgi:(p)ppGpp synthase/HD superfamily hydrolase
MNIVNDAMRFALLHHADQDHGSLKIEDHLKAVTDKMKEHGWFYADLFTPVDPEKVIAAGWLHDVLEDTDVTFEQLEQEFGGAIAHIVERVTDKPGKNRLERHLATYHGIRLDPAATFVKLCDRWHNQQRSIDLKEGRFASMYEKEYLYFKFALYNPYTFQKLWKELDAQYEQLKDLCETELAFSR